ncbi:MAG: hypothetical protein OSB34_06855 [Planktomarina sp.]|nr:hypothetical protein [Planktomarina sp.]
MTGFLGAGKTTLLNKIIVQPSGPNKAMASRGSYNRATN